MNRRKLWLTLGALALSVGLVSGTFVTTASGAPSQFSTQYMAKFVCGFKPFAPGQEHEVKPGNYATAINIGNHLNFTVTGQWRILPHYPALGVPPAVAPPVAFTAVGARTVEIDCTHIWATVNPPLPIGTFLKGFVHIGLSQQLAVVAVYTAQTDLSDPALGGAEPPPDAGAGISIDVEHIPPFSLTPG